MKDESNRFIGTVLEYEAPFEAVKNILATTSTESKSSDLKNESSIEKNEKVFIKKYIIFTISLFNISCIIENYIIYIF